MNLAHLQYGFEGFDDDAETASAVPIVAPHELTEAFVVDPADSELFERAVETVARERALQVLRTLLLALPPTAQYIALRRVIIGDRGQSSRDAGDEAGVSHTAILKTEELLRECLPGFQTPHTCI